MTKYHIAWQKWYDPYGADDGIPELVSDELFNTSEELDGYVSMNEEEEGVGDALSINNKQMHVLSTPMGMVPINSNTNPSKIFNFWVGHTNFNITPIVADVINEVEGIETLDVFTRYRVRIGIGKNPNFHVGTILRNVNAAVSGAMKG